MSEAIPITPYPTLQRARFAQCVLALVGLFSTMDSQIVGLLVEPIKLDLGLTDVEVGLAYGTAYFAAYGLLAVPAGMLADRISRVRLLLAAMLLNCVGLCLTGLSHNLLMLVLSKIVMGASFAITYPAAMSVLADFFQPEKRAMGTYSFAVGQQLGGVAALLIGGLGYTALVNRVAIEPQIMGGLPAWRLMSLMFAAVGILIIPLLLATREPARMEIKSAGKGSFRELWDYRRILLPLFIAMMSLYGATSGLGTWFAPTLMRLYKLQPADFAVAASIITGGGGFLSGLAAVKLVNIARLRKDTQVPTLPAAIVVALSIPCTMMGMMPNVTGFAVLASLFMFFNGIGMTLPVLAINFIMPNNLRGLCIGTYIVLLAIAGTIGAPLVAYVGRLLGGDMMIGYAIAVVCAPLAAVSAVSFWVASRIHADIYDSDTISDPGASQ